MANGLKFSEQELADLRGVVYGGYKKTPDQYLKLQEGRKKKIPGGKIDYSFYSGQSQQATYPGLRKRYTPAEKGSVSANFAKIAEELGIKDVSSTNDLRQMYDYVLNYNRTTGAPVEEKKAESTSVPGATANDKDGDGYLDVGGIPKTGSGAIDFRMFVGKDEASRKAAFEQHGEHHFGINALRRAQAATGLSIKEIEKQAWDQGLRFGEHASVYRDTQNYQATGVQDLKDQITTLTTSFDTKIKEYQDTITNMQKTNAEEMAKLQSQMNQAVVQAANRPTTLGVKSPGKPFKAANYGATGFFGRDGMRIKSVNI